MDMGEEVVQPLADIDLRHFAASHEGVDDGCVLCSVVVPAEEIVLPADSQRSDTVLNKIVVYLVPAVGDVALQFA